MNGLNDLNWPRYFVGARHRFALEIAFRLQKATAKLLNESANQEVALVRPGATLPVDRFELALARNDSDPGLGPWDERVELSRAVERLHITVAY